MKKILSILLNVFFIILISNNVSAQGCVAIKGTAGICSRPTERNRTQSDSDKRRTIDTGVHQQGDAAFADYSINARLTIRL
jgi:hypothetical protein